MQNKTNKSRFNLYLTLTSKPETPVQGLLRHVMFPSTGNLIVADFILIQNQEGIVKRLDSRLSVRPGHFQLLPRQSERLQTQHISFSLPNSFNLKQRYFYNHISYLAVKCPVSFWRYGKSKLEFRQEKEGPMN